WGGGGGGPPPPPPFFLSGGAPARPPPAARGPETPHFLIIDGHGTLLAVTLTSGNRNDVNQLVPLLDAVPLLCGRPGPPRRKPQSAFTDRSYDHDVYRDQVRASRIPPVIARRDTPHRSGLGVHRWVVERTFAWLHGFRRLHIRRQGRTDIHKAFLTLACCLITRRQVLSLTCPTLAPWRQTDLAN
ncbi:transposase, partial [Streptomyces sp. NPDC088847]|uniref:transposase n=1 Tax=Streptomyces sp. NPDC088847 TaxID=3365909 RepID=UPI00382306FA